MSAELLLAVRSIPPTAEHNATLHRPLTSRGKKKAWMSGMVVGVPSTLHLDLSFLLVSAVI